jgi:hypothetical protein
VPTLHAEGDIVQDLNCGMTATTRIVKREMIDLENRIVLVLVVGGRHNSAVAHSSFLLQNSYPAKLSQCH